MPLVSSDVERSYCRYCGDEEDNLNDRKDVQQGIAQWLEAWAPEGTEADFLKRAEFYMKAMPAWADE